MSRNLWNEAHVDSDDAERSFAIWVRLRIHAPPPPQWWLLFPSVGLAVVLVDGVRISWDGRCAHHCSISEPGEGDALFSLFACTSRSVQAAEARQARYREVARATAANDVAVGDAVVVRVPPRRTGLRSARVRALKRGRVSQVIDDVVDSPCGSAYRVCISSANGSKDVTVMRDELVPAW